MVGIVVVYRDCRLKLASSLVLTAAITLHHPPSQTLYGSAMEDFVWCGLLEPDATGMRWVERGRAHPDISGEHAGMDKGRSPLSYTLHSIRECRSVKVRLGGRYPTPAPNRQNITMELKPLKVQRVAL